MTTIRNPQFKHETKESDTSQHKQDELCQNTLELQGEHGEEISESQYDPKPGQKFDDTENPNSHTRTKVFHNNTPENPRCGPSRGTDNRRQSIRTTKEAYTSKG